MSIDLLFAEDKAAREKALERSWAAATHERSQLAGKLAFIAKEAAAAFMVAADAGADTRVLGTRLQRACLALSRMRVEVAKSCLFRIADEGSSAVKELLAETLKGTPTVEGRAVLVHLLSDDKGRRHALRAIAAAPWPDVLPSLIDLSEADDSTARLALKAIARCGVASGVDEACAAADFLFELLDDEELFGDAFDAVLRCGLTLPGVVERARRLVREGGGAKKAAGICLYAACGNDGTADLLELALGGGKTDRDAAMTLLEPLLLAGEVTVRSAAERTWKVLDLAHK